MELGKVRDLIWKLSAQDRTRIFAELIEKYNLDRHAIVYCCDICDKTGYEMHGEYSNGEFFSCEDCTDITCCRKCARKMMKKNMAGDYIFCRKCAKEDDNKKKLQEYALKIKCSSCKQSEVFYPKKGEEDKCCQKCKNCDNKICEDCIADECVKTCKICNEIFCNDCRSLSMVNNSECVLCSVEKEMNKKIEKEKKKRKEKQK